MDEVGESQISEARPGAPMVTVKLIDLDASGDDRICVDYLIDLFAMVDDYKVYVERGGGPEEPGGALDELMMTADPVQSGFTA